MSKLSKGFNKPKPTKRQQEKRELEHRANLVDKDGKDISSNRAKKKLAKGDF